MNIQQKELRNTRREIASISSLQTWAEKANFATNELGFSVLMGRAIASHFDVLVDDIKTVYSQEFPNKIIKKNSEQIFSIVKVYRRFLEEIALPASNFDSQNGWQLFLYALKGPELALAQSADQATSDQNFRDFKTKLKELFSFRMQVGRDFFSKEPHRAHDISAATANSLNVTEKILMTFFQEQVHNFPANEQTIKEIPTLPAERETKFDQQNPTIEIILERHRELLERAGANLSADSDQQLVQQLSQWCTKQLELAKKSGIDIQSASVFLEPKSPSSHNKGFRIRVPTVFVNILERYSRATYLWKDFNSADITELLTLAVDTNDHQLRIAYLSRVAALLLAVLNLEKTFLHDWNRHVIVKGDGSLLTKNS